MPNKECPVSRYGSDGRGRFRGVGELLLAGAGLLAPLLGLALLAAGCGGVRSSGSTEDAGGDGAPPLAGAFAQAVREINETTGARQMAAADLRRLLAQGEPVVLVDVRSAEEQAVSTLPGAWRVTPEEIPELELELPSPDAAVVTYCTVGYRSGLAAVELERRLGRPVFNLDGGLIGWFNAGGAVVDPQGAPADRIHPYDREWGRFVRDRP